jgi:hypothetical protein
MYDGFMKAMKIEDIIKKQMPCGEFEVNAMYFSIWVFTKRCFLWI